MHFAPDRQFEKEGDKKNQMLGGGMMMLGGGFIDMESITQMFLDASEQFNVTHMVNKLSFGLPIGEDRRQALNLTSQLDGAFRTVADGYGMFQYYLQVVPTVFHFLNGTTIETFQY